MEEGNIGTKFNDNVKFVGMVEDGNYVPFNQILEETPVFSTIRLEKGRYHVKEAIQINKSIKLEGVGIGETVLVGKGVKNILSSSGNYSIVLECISFEMEDDQDCTTVVQLNCNEVFVNKCGFLNAKRNDNNDFGIGLEIDGETQAQILNCRFENNQESGALISGSTKGVFVNCEAKNNDSGFTATQNSELTISKSISCENNIGVTFADDTTGTIKECVLSQNKAGVMAKNTSKPLVLNCEIHNNIAGVALAEECEVSIEENKISNNQYGVVLRNGSEGKIVGNKFFKNEEGVHSFNASRMAIINNHIYHQKYYGVVHGEFSLAAVYGNEIVENQSIGIITESYLDVDIKENKIIGNFQGGILTSGQSSGSISENFIKNNGTFNLIIRNEEKVKNINNTIIESEIIVPELKETNGEYVIEPLDIGTPINFEKVIEQVQSNQTIRFLSGVYFLNQPININKPINLIAEEPDTVFLNGIELDTLINYSSGGKLNLKNLNLQLSAPRNSNVVVINSGEFECENCTFEYAMDQEESKHDFGAGISLRNTSKSIIKNSKFERNSFGIAVLNQATAKIEESNFFKNGYGIIFRDESTGTVQKNRFVENKTYGVLAYDQTNVEVVGNSCNRNIAGIGFINNAKGTIKDNHSFENEQHGIFMDHDTECLIESNICNNNGDSGIVLAGNANIHINKNFCHDNENFGIQAFENANVTIKNNQCYQNGIGGIGLSDSASAIINQNELFENQYGIQIEDEANAQMDDNKIYDNSEDGIKDKSNEEIDFNQLGILNAEEENYEEARRYFSKAYEVEPENLLALYNRAMMSFNLEDYDKTVEDFINYLNLIKPEIDYDVFEPLFNALDNKEDWDFAIKVLSDLLEIYPEEGEILAKRGEVYAEQSNWDKAFADFTKLIELDADSFDPYVYRALAYERKGDIQAAISDYGTYLERITEDDDSKFNLEAIKEIIIVLKKSNDSENTIDDLENKTEKEEDVYYRIAQSDGSVYFVHRNEKKDPVWCWIIDENGEISHHGRNWYIIEPLVKNGTAVKVTYKEVMDELENVDNDYYQLAKQKFIEENYESAWEYLTKEIQQNPENLEAIRQRGHCSWLLDEYEKAIKDYYDYIHLNDHEVDPEFYELFFQALLANQDWDLAVSIYSELLEKHPEMHEILGYRGFAYNQLSKFGLAINDFNKELETSPEESINYNYRAYSYENLGNITAAISDYRAYLELADDDIKNKSEIEEKIIELRKSIDIQKTINDLDNFTIEEKKTELAQQHSANGWKLFIEQSLLEKAQTELMIALDLDPTISVTHEAIHFIYVKNKDWNKAISHITEAIRLDPVSEELFYNRAAVYLSIGKPDEAIEDCKRSILLNPDYIKAYLGLGATYLSKGDFAQAIKYLNETINRNPNIPVTYLHRASAHEKSGNKRAALSDFQKYYDLGGGPEVNLDDLKEHILYLRSNFNL